MAKTIPLKAGIKRYTGNHFFKGEEAGKINIFMYVYIYIFMYIYGRSIKMSARLSCSAVFKITNLQTHDHLFLLFATDSSQTSLKVVENPERYKQSNNLANMTINYINPNNLCTARSPTLIKINTHSKFQFTFKGKSLQKQTANRCAGKGGTLTQAKEWQIQNTHDWGGYFSDKTNQV